MFFLLNKESVEKQEDEKSKDFELHIFSPNNRGINCVRAHHTALFLPSIAEVPVLIFHCPPSTFDCQITSSLFQIFAGLYFPFLR